MIADASFRRSTLISSLGITFFLTATLILLRLPTPLELIHDQDWAHQLAGANQILRGQHPFIHYLVTYGPLTFYSSALAQWISGYRVIGEMILVVLGYSIGYSILFWLMWSLAGNRFLAMLLTLILVIALPRMYKYYILMGPALTLWMLWLYIEKPSNKRLLFVGLAVAFTGLFRPDFGVYMAIASCTPIVLQPGAGVKWKLVNLVKLFAMILIGASPWLIWAGYGQGLDTYLYASTINAVNHGMGMSTPFRFDHTQIFNLKNLPFFATLGFLVIPVFTLVLLLNQRDVTSKRKLQVITAILVGQLSLIQMIHRSDFFHFLQAIPLTFVLFAWIISQSVSSIRNATSKVQTILPAIGLACVVFLLTSLTVFTFPSWRKQSLTKSFASLRVFMLQRDRFTEHLIQQNPNDPLMQTMAFVKNCTTDETPIVAWPALLSFYYFLNRPQGSILMGLSPGFFDAPKFQASVVEELRSGKIPFFIHEPRGLTQRARNLSDFVPMIADCLNTQYVPVQQYGNITIYVHRLRRSSFHCLDHIANPLR